MTDQTPVEGRGAAEYVYGAVRRQIIAGERAGGDWLREGDLATELGVSRTPIREALQRLSAEGLTRHEPNRGVRVESWTSGDLDEIFSLRSILEPWGSARAATSGLAELDRLDSLAVEMDRCAAQERPDFDEITRLNNEFHRLVLEAAGHGRLVQLVTTVVDVPLVWRTFSHYSPESLRRSLAHHHELVDALRARDSDWAESVMRSHVRAAWSSIRQAQPSGSELIGSTLPATPTKPPAGKRTAAER